LSKRQYDAKAYALYEKESRCGNCINYGGEVFNDSFYHKFSRASASKKLKVRRELTKLFIELGTSFFGTQCRP